MIDINKKYRTRDGHEVRIYATDGGKYRVHGAVKYPACGWISRSWTEEGKFLKFVACESYDLVEVKPRIKETVWINIYDVFKSISHFEKVAEERADCSIRARVKVDIDVEEGHGL
jgi:hypothetical protein